MGLDSFEKDFKIKLGGKRMIISILIAISVGYIAKYSFNCDKKEVIAISSVALIAMTMLYHSANFEKIDLDKKVVALNIITEWYKEFSEKSRSIKEFREKYSTAINEAIKTGEINKINKLVENEPDTAGILYVFSLMPILNYFEKISIAIEHNVADEKIIKDYFKDIFVVYHDTFHPIIKQRQIKSGGLPTAFIKYESLVSRWESQKKG